MRFLQNTISLSVLVTLIILVIACDTKNPYELDYSAAPDPYPIDNATSVETESGLKYYIVEEGKGEIEVTIRDQIDIFYTKRKENGEIFQSSYTNGNINPSSIIVSNSTVIAEKGFKEGVMGMKEGEIRVLIIPPKLAYGEHSSHQLSNDTIRIDVELDRIAF